MGKARQNAKKLLQAAAETKSLEAMLLERVMLSMLLRLQNVSLTSTSYDREARPRG